LSQESNYPEVDCYNNVNFGLIPETSFYVLMFIFLKMNFILNRLIAGSLFLILLSCSKGSGNQNPDTYHSHGIIPLPRQTDYLPGNLIVDSTAIIIGDEQYASAKKVLDESLSIALLNRLKDGSDTTGKMIIRFITDNSLTEEGYEINITNEGISLSSESARGAYYAAQSLRQMIWEITLGRKHPSFEMRQMKVSDSPKYSWRGFHIDLSRHMFTKEYIEKVIDELAYYKINKLHLHLSDDQGWRVEISQFPLLTETGAWRPFNEMDSACMGKAETDSKYIIDTRFIRSAGGKTEYGGYFTRQDIADIIAYAGDHFIDVIPEIDMPGHMTAAINSYPFLSCTGSAGWGTEFSYPICPCNDEVIKFCHMVWDEIAVLFPSEYVHIGCDEVDKNAWQASAACQSFMVQHNLHGINDLQNYFLSDLQNYMESKGKTVIAWDDVIDGKADNNLIMMYWRDWVTDSPARCAANGNNIILTPWSPFYISGDHTDKTLKDLYDYDAETRFPSQVTSKITGLQSCLWTEEIPSEAMFEYLVYPRMQALAEVAWGAAKDWTTFKIRLASHLKYMTSKNIRYRKPGWAK
jgi:hexosaminidase